MSDLTLYYPTGTTGFIGVTFNKFDKGAYKRHRVKWESMDNEAKRAVPIGIHNKQDGYQWDVTAICNFTNKTTMDSMPLIAQQLKIANQPYYVKISDTMERYSEPAPISNYSVTSPSSITISNGLVSYFCIFAGWIVNFEAVRARTITNGERTNWDTNICEKDLVYKITMTVQGWPIPLTLSSINQGIILSLGTLSVNLTKFEDNGYERYIPEWTTVERSVYGAVLASGPWHSQYFIWTINAQCTYAQRLIVEAIAVNSDALRRTLDDFRITCQDYMEPVASSDGTSGAFESFNVALTNLKNTWLESGSLNVATRQYLTSFSLTQVN